MSAGKGGEDGGVLTRGVRPRAGGYIRPYVGCRTVEVHDARERVWEKGEK